MTYLITFPHFEPIVAQDLTPEEVAAVCTIKRGMSTDAYAGYSPEEQAKWHDIKNAVGSKKLEIERL